MLWPAACAGLLCSCFECSVHLASGRYFQVSSALQPPLVFPHEKQLKEFSTTSMFDRDAVLAKHLRCAKLKHEHTWSITVHEECSAVMCNTGTMECIAYTSQKIQLMLNNLEASRTWIGGALEGTCQGSTWRKEGMSSARELLRKSQLSSYYLQTSYNQNHCWRLGCISLADNLCFLCEKCDSYSLGLETSTTKAWFCNLLAGM